LRKRKGAGSRDGEHGSLREHHHTVINLYTKLASSSFTHTRDGTEAPKLEMGHVTLTMPVKRRFQLCTKYEVSSLSHPKDEKASSKLQSKVV